MAPRITSLEIGRMPKVLRGKNRHAELIALCWNVVENESWKVNVKETRQPITHMV